MKAEKLGNNQVLIELSIKEADDLQDEIHEDARHMPSVLLDLASVLRLAKYEAQSEFRQPPNAWEKGAKHPSVEE